jgi:hypothetical protein
MEKRMKSNDGSSSNIRLSGIRRKRSRSPLLSKEAKSPLTPIDREKRIK